jgi:hypothetical protein
MPQGNDPCSRKLLSNYLVGNQAVWAMALMTDL